MDSEQISNFKITCVYYTSAVKENILQMRAAFSLSGSDVINKEKGKLKAD